MAGRKENEARTSLIEKKEDESSGSSDREEDNETTGLQPWTCRLASDHEEEDRSVATARLSKAVIFCLVFMVVEVAGGVWANSLAILTDAAHMLSDVASFAISLFALWAASWDATPRRSYGFHRLEILGALLSIQIIWLITGILVYEAIDRLIHATQPVDGKLMCVIAALGLVVNLAMIFLLGHGHEHGGEGAHSHGFGHSHGVGHGHDHAHAHNHAHDHDHDHGHNHGGHHDHHEQLSADDPARPVAVDLQDGGRSGQGTCIAYAVKDGKRTCQTIKVDQDVEHGGGVSSGNINVRGAYLHVLGDLIQSIGVLIAGAVIWYKPDWQIVDPVCTLLFAVLVLFTTIRILRDILDVLMENTPREIDAQKLEAGLSSIQDVVAVHELHIWAITVGKTLLACHVTIQPGADYSKVLEDVIAYCRTDFKISHVTVQIEVARDVGGSQQALSHC